MTSGVFLIDGNISEGEYLGEGWLEESLWKEKPKRVIAPYSKTPSCSLLFILSTLGKDNPEGSKSD